MGKREEFPSTHWTLVTMANADDESVRQQGLAQFLTRYFPAMRSYLEGPLGIAHHDAEDLVQGFIADKVVGRELLSYVLTEKGRLRAYLKASLHNYVRSQYRSSANKMRRAALAYEQPADERGTPNRDPYDVFDTAWAREVLREAIARMESHCKTVERQDLWLAFSTRVLRPTMLEEPAMSCSDLAARLGLRNEAEASNLVVTAKRMFTRTLKDVIAGYTGSPEAVEDELRELRSIVASSRAVALTLPSGA